MIYSVVDTKEILICRFCHRNIAQCSKYKGKFEYGQEIICDMRQHKHQGC